MNIFQKKTNQKWQNVLNKIKNQKNNSLNDNQNNINDKIKQILTENTQEELKDYDQIYFLQQSLNNHPFFLDLWQFWSEQFTRKVITDYDQQNGIIDKNEEQKDASHLPSKKSVNAKRSQSSEKKDIKNSRNELDKTIDQQIDKQKWSEKQLGNKQKINSSHQQVIYHNKNEYSKKTDVTRLKVNDFDYQFQDNSKINFSNDKQHGRCDRNNEQINCFNQPQKNSQSPIKAQISEKINIENNSYEYYKKIDENNRKIKEVESQVDSKLKEIQIKLFSHLKLKQYQENNFIYEDGKVRCDENCPSKNAKNTKFTKEQFYSESKSTYEVKKDYIGEQNQQDSSIQCEDKQNSKSEKEQSSQQRDQINLEIISPNKQVSEQDLFEAQSKSNEENSSINIREKSDQESWQVCLKCQYFYIVWQGEIEEQISDEITRFSSDSFEIPKSKILKDGDYFGEKELIFRGKRHATIKCNKLTFVFYLNREIFNSVISSFIKFKNPILSSLDQGAPKSMVSLFLKKEHLIQLSYLQQPRTLIYGSLVYNENEIADSLYVLSQGQINFSKRITSQLDHLENSRVTPPKRCQQISIITQVQYFGEENLYLKYDQELQELNEEQDSMHLEEEKKLFLQTQQKRQYTATVSSDKAVVHKIPYAFLLEKMYQKQKNFQKVHMLLNKYIQQKSEWKSKNQERIEKVIQNRSFSQFIQGKSSNMLVCKTGNPLEKYSLNRLREPEKQSSLQDFQNCNQLSVKSKKRASRLLRKMSTVNSIVLTEENQDIQQLITSQNSFSKLQDITQINNALCSYHIQQSSNISPEKKVQLNYQNQQQQENDFQQKYFLSVLDNNSKMGNQFSQINLSSKYRKNDRNKDQDINFLDFILQREQSDYMKNLNQLQSTPKTCYKQSQIQFNQNTSFIQNNKDNSYSQLKEKNQFQQNKDQFDKNGINYLKQNQSISNIQSHNQFISEGREKMFVQYQNKDQVKIQSDSLNRKNIVKTQQRSRDISPNIKVKQDYSRRSTILNNSKGNNYLATQDLQDRNQSFITDTQQKSVSLPKKQQNQNYQTTPRSRQQAQNFNKQRLVTDIDEYCKSNTYLEQLIDEKQQQLRKNSSAVFEDLIYSNNFDLNEDNAQTNSLKKRKQYSVMLEIQKTQQKIPISISNQRCISYDLDYEKTSSQVLKFKKNAIRQLTNSKLPVKLDVSGICQQTHRFDYLKRKLEQKKKNLQQMKQFEQGEQTKIPSSAVQYKKSESIVLNLVDNYFKNISNNSGYPQGPCLKTLLQNTPNTKNGNINTTINGQSTQYSKSGSTKPFTEVSKSSYINYFRSPMKSAQSYRSKSNPRQNNSKTIQNNSIGQKQFSLTNNTFYDHSKDLNQAFSTFITNTQFSPF
ncbi:cyclic nucleotide-binding domain protein (macronuclear) [Tetrahymena thermophila SB210]|uniref:Cyclic nucleotide-binding domain protein n=1 Tax=Tetrahymena thermophila (strain SB210) TaxID=312017 RepID=I7LXL2_TETTS|nr:cyclic nucleotide-binding domain protein [Tetrahymena thermophila SB210]EAS04860.1 cyclic nucleotide-binding domain protein [Tetrahymena thermophila SB210]|eukprot:XP_001025105.1 cyclic nucleotide-binding domain protein [Tetrahymena thermophila SB210]